MAVAQLLERTQCHGAAQFNVVKMANLMLRVFCYNKKKFEKNE